MKTKRVTMHLPGLSDAVESRPHYGYHEGRETVFNFDIVMLYIEDNAQTAIVATREYSAVNSGSPQQQSPVISEVIEKWQNRQGWKKVNTLKSIPEVKYHE